MAVTLPLEVNKNKGLREDNNDHPITDPHAMKTRGNILIKYELNCLNFDNSGKIDILTTVQIQMGLQSLTNGLRWNKKTTSTTAL